MRDVGLNPYEAMPSPPPCSHLPLAVPMFPHG